ncbi:MAG: hypothetical protein C4304_08125 [candidate division GAL15 bacterium]
MGVVTSDVCYTLVREVLLEASVLRLGMSCPLPIDAVRSFASQVRRVFVVEGVRPFLEEALRVLGIGDAAEAARQAARTGADDLERKGYFVEDAEVVVVAYGIAAWAAKAAVCRAGGCVCEQGCSGPGCCSLLPRAACGSWPARLAPSWWQR